MTLGDQIPRKPQDKPEANKDARGKDLDSAGTWNAKESQRSDKPSNQLENVDLEKPRITEEDIEENILSPAEQAERQKVEPLPGAIARPFGKPPTWENKVDWYNNLSGEIQKKMDNPKNTIELKVLTSRPGSFEANKALAEKSFQDVKNFLKNVVGVKAKIFGSMEIYDKGAPPGEDNRFERQVMVSISTKEDVRGGYYLEAEWAESKESAILREPGQPPSEKSVRDWFNQFSPEQKEQAKDPGNKLNIEFYDRDGDAPADEIIRNIESILREKLGVKAEIQYHPISKDESSVWGTFSDKEYFHNRIFTNIEVGESQKKILTPSNVEGGLTADGAEIEKDPAILKTINTFTSMSLKDLPDCISSKIRKAIVDETSKVVDIYGDDRLGSLRHASESKKVSFQGDPIEGELNGIRDVLEVFRKDFDAGTITQISEGRPFEVEKVRDQIKAANFQDTENNLKTLRVFNRDIDGAYENGIELAVSLLNDLTKNLNTPLERQMALIVFTHNLSNITHGSILKNEIYKYK